ncbi:putative ribonuclease H-like domain-containing protein [Tanacetum coccineum]
MRTKPGVDSLSFDDLYNNLRVFETGVKGSTGSSSSAQNVAFVSSESTSSTNDVSTAYGATTSSKYNLQRENSSLYTNELMHSFLANQSSSPQLDHEDLEQIDEFDLEEIDLKWQVAMISMRLKKFYKKTGRKLQFDAKEPVGFDKTKVECFNCHKTGHFARECRSKGNQDIRRRDAGNTGYKAKDNGRRPGKQEEPKALVTLDGDGVDWTGHAEDEQENFALMAYSHSGSDTEVTSCLKECEESYTKLKKLYDEQKEQLGDASIEIKAYTLALAKVEAQLVCHQKNQLAYEEKIRFMKIDLDDKTDVLTYHKKLLAEAVKEKEELKTKLEKWQNSSKSLNKLLDTLMSVFDSHSSDIEDAPVYDRFAKVEGMHAIPPSMIGNYMPPKSDFGINDVETLESVPELVVIEPRVVSQPKVWFDAPIIEEYEETVKEQNICNQSPKVDKRDWNCLMSKKLGLGYGFTRKACFVCGSFGHLIIDYDFHEKRMAKQVELNKKKSKGTGQGENRPDDPQQTLKGKGIIDSGCSKHMTGNKAYLVDYQEFKGGSVIFGELQDFNLFFVSQMCDKKNKVLFTDTECLVLSPEFKLPDETQERFCCYIYKGPQLRNPTNAKSKGIKREYSNARIPQQNGVAERKNRTLIVAARTMLADSFLPNTFWAEAVSTTCYVLNRVLVTKPQNKTPYELITGKIPIISYIRLFGCHMTILNTIEHLGKFEEKSDEGFLVGYSLNSKAFRVYNLETKRVEENLHTNFLENKPNVAGKGPAWLFDLDYLTDSMNYQHVTAENKANKTVGPKKANNSAGTQDNNAENFEMEAEPAQEYFVLPLWSSYTSTIKSSKANNGSKKPNWEITSKTNEEPVDQAHQDLLLQAGAARASSTKYVNTTSTPVNTASPSRNVRPAGLSYPDPSKYANQDDSQILGLEDIYEVPNEEIFISASYDDEGAVVDFTNLETIVNVSPIPQSRIYSIHPSTQILRDPYSAIQTRSKVNKSSGAHALIEPKNISQALEDESWVDAMQEELLQFKIQKVWIMVDLPLVTHGHRQEEGIDYDEVFAPVASFEAIKIFLAFASYMGFIVYQMDVKSTFLYGTIDEEVYVSQPLGFIDPKFPKKVYKVVKALYGLHQAPRAWYATLSTFFEKSGYRRGTIDKTQFIKRDKKDIMLVQVYMDDIIIGSTKKSWCDEFEALMKRRFQMSSMGELTFFLGLQVKQKEDGIFISQDKYVAEIMKKFDFMSVKTASTPIETQKPLVKDEEAADVDVHLYRSMIGSLMYLTASRPDIMFVVCACYRFQVTPKTSHLHAVKRIFRRLISWQCKKQIIMATSTTEAEYVVAANYCGQVLWIHNQMLDYGFNFLNTKIYIDNKSIICIVNNPVFHSKTKHIEIRHHFIRDAYEKKLIQVLKIHTNDNVADLLTKSFDVSRFNFLIVNIGMLNL